MLRASRARMAAGLVLGILGVTTVAAAAVFPTPAYAATTGFTTYTGQGNLTVLPSTAQPLLAGVADASPQGQVGQYLYAAMKDPKKMAAITALYQRAQAGTATAAETAELATAVRASAPVATKALTLTRGVAGAAGPAGAALTSAQVGFMVGGGVSRAFGLDVDGTLCTGGIGGQALAVVSMTDCNAFWDTINKGAINSDAPAGNTVTASCIPGSSVCGKYVGAVVQPFQGSTRTWLGFDYTGTTAIVNGSYPRIKVGNDFWRAIVFDQAASGGYASPYVLKCPMSYCPAGASYAGYVETASGGYVASASRYGWLNETTNAKTSDGTVTPSSGNPQRAQRCQQTYQSGRTDTVTGSTRSLSDGMPPAPDLPVPAGEIVTNIQCEVYAPDGTAPTFKTFDQKTSDEFVKSRAVNPECGSTTVCELQLVKPDGKVCNDTDTQCAAWQDSPDAAQWTCRWGNSAIGFKPADMSECNWYSNRWDPQHQASGNTLTRPAASSPTKSPESITNPAPSKTPGTDPNLSNEPVKDPEKSDAQCFPNGWGALNPLAWVYQPVKCALEWAFVPRPSKMKETGDRLTKSWKSTSPFVLADAVGTWDFEPAMTGCNGIPLPADLIYKGMPAQRIASACEGTPLHPAAVAIRVFLNIFFGVGAAWMIASYMGWTIGFKGPAD